MQITIYSTSTCASCRTLTTWLDKIGYGYTKKITDEDPNIMAEFMTVNDGMVGVPFMVISDEKGNVTKISGFDQKRIKQALGA